MSGQPWQHPQSPKPSGPCLQQLLKKRRAVAPEPPPQLCRGCPAPGPGVPGPTHLFTLRALEVDVAVAFSAFGRRAQLTEPVRASGLGQPRVAEGPTGHSHGELGGGAVEVSWGARQVVSVMEASQDQAHSRVQTPLTPAPRSGASSPCSKAEVPTPPSWSASSSLVVPLDMRSNFLKSPEQETGASDTLSRERAGLRHARRSPGPPVARSPSTGDVVSSAPPPPGRSFT